MQPEVRNFILLLSNCFFTNLPFISVPVLIVEGFFAFTTFPSWNYLKSINRFPLHILTANKMISDMAGKKSATCQCKLRHQLPVIITLNFLSILERSAKLRSPACWQQLCQAQPEIPYET